MIGFFLLAFVATLLSTVVGFGSGILLVAGGTLFFEVKWSIALATHLFLFNTWWKTVGLWPHVEKRIALTILITALPATWLGARFLLESSGIWIERILGLIILVDLLVDTMSRRRTRGSHDREDKQASGKLSGSKVALTGAAYGWLSGAVGSGSVVKAMVFRRAGWPHQTFVATMAATALLLNILKVAVFWKARLVGPSDVPWIAGLLAVSWLGVGVGRRWLASIQPGHAAVLVRFMLGAVALRLLLA